MGFYPIELMQKEIENLKNEMKDVECTSKNNDYINACKYVNETRIIQLRSLLLFLEKVESIPIVDNH